MIYDRFRIKRKDAILILFNNVEFLHAALLYHTYNKINELQLAYGWCILLLAGCLSSTIIEAVQSNLLYVRVSAKTQAPGSQSLIYYSI